MPIFRHRTWSSSSRSRAEHGFSLIELLCVLIMLAALAGMAVPSFVSSLREERLRSTTRNIISMTRLARGRAVNRAHVVRLNFDLEQRTYFLTELEETQDALQPTSPSQSQSQETEREWIPIRTHIARERVLAEEVSLVYIGGPPEQSEEEERRLTREAELGALGYADYIEFYPDGTAEETYIALENTVGTRLVVMLDEITGDPVMLAAEDAESLLAAVGAGWGD